MREKPRVFQQHIHVFRGISIILIVGAHTMPALDWANSPIAHYFFDLLVDESSTFFAFIAGYLFQRLSSGFTYRDYLTRKLKTVLVPYVILSIPAIFVFTVLTQRNGMWSGFYALPLLAQAGLFIVTGKHLAPMWFIPTIAIFYLAAPLFIWIDRRFLFGYWFIVPLLVVAIFSGRGGQYGPLNLALYLLPVYLIGMLVSRYDREAMRLVRKWWPLLASICVVSALVMWWDWPTPPYWQMLFKVGIALLGLWLLEKYQGVFGSRLNHMAQVSYGIFFVHAYLIIMIKMVYVYATAGGLYKGEDATLMSGNPLTLLLYMATVLAGSILIIGIVRRVFKSHSRMIIGA